MVEKEFGHEGEVFTIDWVLHSIHLKHGNFCFLVSIYFISRWMMQRTRFAVSFQLFYQGKETQTKFAHIQTVYVVIVNRVGAIVPGFRHVLS
jgi:hypothetical protein